jgi:hypothetical protein
MKASTDLGLERSNCRWVQHGEVGRGLHGDPEAQVALSFDVSSVTCSVRIHNYTGRNLLEALFTNVARKGKAQKKNGRRLAESVFPLRASIWVLRRWNLVAQCPPSQVSIAPLVPPSSGSRVYIWRRSRRCGCRPGLHHTDAACRD